MRRAWLDARLKANFGVGGPAVYGSLVHGLFQTVVEEGAWDDATVDSAMQVRAAGRAAGGVRVRAGAGAGARVWAERGGGAHAHPLSVDRHPK